MSERLSKGNLNRKAAIAGVFFIFAQLLVRGITFILTPVYTRLVSTAQYGELRVYESWLLIIVPVLSLSMFKSVNRARFDFRDNYEEYVSSVQGLSYIVIASCYTIVTLFFRKQVMDFMGLDVLMYVFMILYTFSYSSVLYYQNRERQMMRYKRSVTLTILMMLPATILSILLLYWGNVHKLHDSLVDLRVLGYFTPQIIGGLIVAFIMWKQGGFKVSPKYWKYAVAFSVPLIPEALSIQIMNQSDKIMIQKMVGNDFTGIFSLATTISFIIWIIEDAVWGAWMPWLYEKLDRNEIQDIQRPWDYVTYLFGYISWCLVISAPEVILLLGGKRYADAVYLVAPMVTGTLFRFFSYSFTAVENYQKQTKYCALGTFIAMIVNVVLNAVCIKYIGYQAAAYTTAFSYFVLLVVQGCLEKRICGVRCVSLKKIVCLSLLFWAVNELTILLYYCGWYIRWPVFIIVSILVLWKLWPELKKLKVQLKKGR